VLYLSMFYFIKPKQKLSISQDTLVNTIAPKDARIEVTPNANIRAFYVLWKHDKTRKELAAFIDFYYETKDGKLTLDAISLEFEYKLPMYVDFNEVVTEILDGFYAAIGEFTVHDLYTERTYSVKAQDGVAVAAEILTDSRTQSYAEEQQLITEFTNETDVDKVIEKIVKMPTLFRPYTFSAYIAQLRRANLHTQERVETIVKRALDTIVPLGSEIRYLLLFKLILYYKSFTSSYVDLLSPQFIIKELVPVYLKLPVQKEITQLLLADTVLFLLNTGNQALTDAIDEVLGHIKEHKDIFLLYPEIKTVHSFTTKGNYKTAYELYLKTAENKALQILRGVYENYIQPFNLLSDFTNHVIYAAYYPKLSFIDRMRYLPQYLKAKRPLKKQVVFTSVLSFLAVIPFFVAPFVYISFIMARSGEKILINNFLNIDYIVPYVISFIVFALIAVAGFHFLSSDNLSLTKSSETWKKVAGYASTIIGGVIALILVVSMGIGLSSLWLSRDSFWGISGDKFVTGYEQFNISEIKEFTVNFVPCSSLSRNECKLGDLAKTNISFKYQDKALTQKITINLTKTNRDEICRIIDKMGVEPKQSALYFNYKPCEQE
jgi:hypothetical protein